MHRGKYGNLECEVVTCACHWAYGYHEVDLHMVAELVTDLYAPNTENIKEMSPDKRNYTGPPGKWRNNRPLRYGHMPDMREEWHMNTIPHTGFKKTTHDRREKKNWT